MHQGCIAHCEPTGFFRTKALVHFACFTLFLFCSPLYAATVVITLQNGDRISGELVDETPTQLQIKTSYAAIIAVDKTQISQMQPSADSAQAANQQAEVAPTATVASPVAETSAKQPWHLDVDISASNRRGKEQSDNLSISSDWELRDLAWRYSIGAEFDYEIKQNVRKAHKYSINPGLDYFYSEQVFGRAKLDYSYNFLAADYKNIDVSMGPGFSFFKDRDELRLELMALVGVKKAYFRGDEFLLALLGQRESIRFRFASLDYDYQYQLSATALEWYAKGSILKMLDQPIELLDFKYEVHNEMGVRYWLTDKIRLSWSVQHDWTGIDLVLSDGTVHPLDIKDIRQKLSIGASF